MEGAYPTASFVQAMIARWRRQGYRVELEPYIFNAEYTPLPAAASVSQINATFADQGFVCFSITYNGRPPLPGAGVPPRYLDTKVVIQMTRESDGYALQDRPSDLQNVAGIAPRPFQLFVPFVVPARSSWETTCSNQDPTNPVTLHVAFHGALFRLKSRAR